MSNVSLALSSLTAAPTTIAFVDAAVADSGSLVSQFQPGTEVHLLDSSQDAIDQITQVLANRSNVSAVHILSHGSDGALLLGGKTVSDLSKYDAELKQWSDSLTADADILLYGCNVAADGKGKSFVNRLAQITEADVAASDDLTGLGGDWNLEYRTGTIETTAIADMAYQGTLANFRVTTLQDVVNPNDGVISLREAINTTNILGGSNNIFFNVNGTITLTGGELGISNNLSIFGNGASSTTISGNSASRVFNVSNNNVLLSGLTIANGPASVSEGGGIRNSGNLTVRNCTFSGNGAVRGSGIFNVGNLTVNSSTFSANSASNGGGGIFNTGILTVNSSTFNNNLATVDGGGIVNVGNLTVNSSTFNNNSARFGGGVYNRGNLTVNSSTFTGNSATVFGGGIINLASTMTVTGSYFLNNQAPDGGGIAIDGGACTLIGNVIRQNRATNRGGGLFTNSGTVSLQRNNISSNTAATGVDLFGAYFSGGFNLIGKGGGFTGIGNGVNGDVILVA